MLLHAVTELVVAEAQRLGGLALIVTVARERLFDDCLLMRINRSPEVGHGIQLDG
jgi:hypothetical protein